jgi:hypothetical protein
LILVANVDGEGVVFGAIELVQFLQKHANLHAVGRGQGVQLVGMLSLWQVPFEAGACGGGVDRRPLAPTSDILPNLLCCGGAKMSTDKAHFGGLVACGLVAFRFIRHGIRRRGLMESKTGRSAVFVSDFCDRKRMKDSGGVPNLSEQIV